MHHGIEILTVSSGLTLLFGWLLIRKAQAWGFIDIPEERKIHSLPTPRTGGLAMVAGALTTLALAVGLHRWALPHWPWQTILAGAGFTLLGTMDDRFSYHPRRKVLFLLALSALAAWPWLLVARAQGFPGIWFGAVSLHMPLPILGALLTLWFMAVPNAVNIEDAINGYMGGFLLILLGAAAWHGVDTSILVGALLGFLVLNWPRAKHFMGDAGSFGGGFILAEVVLRGGGFIHPVQALIWTAPISMDVAMGLIRRKRLGMSPFDADRSTCPHHLVARFHGSHAMATLLLWSNTLICVLLSSRPLLAGLYLCGYALVLFLLNKQLLFPNRTAAENPPEV